MEYEDSSVLKYVYFGVFGVHKIMGFLHNMMEDSET